MLTGLFRAHPARWGVAGLVVGLVLGLAGGVFAEQQWPDWIPFAGTSPTGRLDQATFAQALRLVQQDYYGRNLDYRALSEGSVKGLIGSLNDPFSQYLTPAQYRSQLSGYAGDYSGGIGIYLSFKGAHPTITGVIAGGPAEAAHLQAGDQITAIDGVPTAGESSDQVSQQIRGKDGSKITLTILRGGQTLTVSTRRAEIHVPFVRSASLPGHILYVRIYSFGDKTADEMAAALKTGLPGSRGMVLDLRDNPGGFIDAAQTVISDFVTSGEAFELRDRTAAVERHNISGAHPAATIPLMVLVNGDSASASEIVAGSLRVHHRARLVGVKTYGKGSVQQDFPLPDGGDLHLTIRHWFLPDGSSVQSVGLRPDLTVALPAGVQEYDVNDPASSPAADTQLAAALQALPGP